MNDDAADEADAEPGSKGAGDVKASTLLKELIAKIVPILLTAAGFLGFVAVAGGVTVYFHFFTAGLPAVKAIEEMPRSQLLVNGAVPLLTFGVLGLLAVAACYAIDRGGRAREGMAYSLILLFAVAAAVVVLVAPVEPKKEIRVLVVIAAGVGLAILLMSQLKSADAKPLPRVERESSAPDAYKGTQWVPLGLIGIAAVVVGATYWFTREWWVVIAIVVAAALAVMNFRIAQGTGNRFMAFGIGVFLSLPLFGAIVGLLFLANQPLVQPAAVIRSTDQGRLVVEGLYVTDNEAHVYLGSIATEGCDDGEVRQGSGSIFSIPKAEVVAMRIGRAQSVRDALRSAPALAELLVRNAGAFPNRKPTATRKTTKSKPKPKPTATATATDQSTETTGQSTETTPPKPKWPLRHTRDQAVREEPKVDAEPSIEGDKITVNGGGFGGTPGRLLVGGRSARIERWSDNEIVARVPAAATTYRVRVRCPRADLVVAAPTG